MILRLRSDLPELVNDPLIPHKAAEYMKDRAAKEHIPYDFEMNCRNADKLFCSEVVSTSYRKFGVTLWERESTISSSAIAELLYGFGVRNFNTLEPSDLEYDPKVRVIAEWRDLETLYSDHVDNAAVDAMLEWIDSENLVPQNHFLLPVFRIVKIYSFFLNKFGIAGPIPEGMSAASALRHEAYSSFHSGIKEFILKRSDEFQIKNGYRPP